MFQWAILLLFAIVFSIRLEHNRIREIQLWLLVFGVPSRCSAAPSGHPYEKFMNTSLGSSAWDKKSCIIDLLLSFQNRAEITCESLTLILKEYSCIPSLFLVKPPAKQDCVDQLSQRGSLWEPVVSQLTGWSLFTDDCLSCRRAFQEYYQEHLEYACPTEDIYLE